MSTIQETIASALNNSGVGEGTARQYGTYISAVTQALVEREQQIADALIEAATDDGHDLDEGDVRAALTEAGLSVRPVPAQVAATSGQQSPEIEGLRAEVRELRLLVEQGVAALRSRGLR